MRYVDCYHSPLGKSFVDTQVAPRIEQTVITNGLSEYSLDVKKYHHIVPVGITGREASENEIPLFVHPRYLELKTHREPIVAMDFRMMLKPDVYKGSFKDLRTAVRNPGDYALARTRWVLSMLWLEQPPRALLLDNGLSTRWFSRWVAGILGRAFHLDAHDRLGVALVTAQYYVSLFFQETAKENEELALFSLRHIPKALQADEVLVQKTIESLPGMHGINDLVEQLRLQSPNIRLKGLDSLAFITLMKNSWIGINAKQIFMAGLENPSTWIALVYTALTHRAFSGASLTKFLLESAKPSEKSEFTDSLDRLLRPYEVSMVMEAFEDYGIAREI